MDEYPWLSHYPEDVDWFAPLPAKPLTACLEESAQRFATHPCLDFFGARWTYKEVNDAATAMAGHLQYMGVVKGVRVGLLLPNHPYFVIAYYAILKAGGIVVNINPLSAPAEITHLIEDSQIRILITTNLTVCYSKAAALADKLDAIITGDFAQAMPTVIRTLFRLTKGCDITRIPLNSKHHALEPLLKGPPPSPVTIIPEQDPAVLQYTGGTTGTPKGAILTHANLYINATQCALWCNALLKDGEERMMGVLPLFHVFAMTVVMNLGLLRGMEIILLPRFDLAQLLKAIQRKRPTTMPGVPTLFAAIANHPRATQCDLTSIRCCISGGAPLPQEIKRRFEAITGCVLVEGYGLTEASPVCSANPLSDGGKSGTIGLPFPGTIFEIRATEPPHDLQPSGTIGEVCISGPHIMQGYWHKESETQHVLKARGSHGTYLRTGDLGKMDEEGYITIVDRLKEMILCRGYNIYPRLIEEALYRHDSIAEAAVIGLPDDTLGQRIKAFVALKPGHTTTPEQLHTFLKPLIATYALPKDIEIRDSLPKSMIGKILKRELLS